MMSKHPIWHLLALVYIVHIWESFFFPLSGVYIEKVVKNLEV